ncbi:mechanosensitive ion channel family protein [Tepidicaulis sp.]|jgi:small conductance mechanosensitive channel|uniref:mechanosensitive ion channel family protein n=1 Tax=Tepidicaulis sp. TaxID=1920809 RepID=UPI003B5AF36E
MPEEWMKLFQENADALMPLVVEHGLNLIGAVAILIIGFWFAGRARNWTVRGLGRMPRFDDMLKNFFGAIVRYLVIIVTVLAVLGQFGIETTSLIAVLGAAGLAVGLALQGTLSNVAAGVMLLIFRPFRTGQYVEVGGIAGTVKELTLFTTELNTPDNVQIIVPNSSVWGQAIRNYNAYSTRRVDITFGISYGDDINKAMDIIKAEIAKDARILKDPEPFIAVLGLGESSVDIVTRSWTATGDYWPVKFDLTKAVKEEFDRGGITIPFPSRTVYNAAD